MLPRPSIGHRTRHLTRRAARRAAARFNRTAPVGWVARAEDSGRGPFRWHATCYKRALRPAIPYHQNPDTPAAA